MYSPETQGSTRVLHVHSGNLWGGVETMLVTIVEHERRVSRMVSEFALCHDGRLAERLEAAGAAVHILGDVRFRRPASIARARRRLSDLLGRTAASVAVMHSSWSAALFGGVVVRSALGRALWAHAPDRGPWWQRVPAERFRQELVICNSRYTCDSLSASVSGTRALCRYPVTLGRHSGDRRRTRMSLGVDGDEAAVVAIAARMEAWKGHTPLIEALGRLRDDPRWTCWVIGRAQNDAERTYERALRNLASQRGVADRVRFLGQREDVRALLEAADIYCQPNLGGEPFGISYIEALEAGIPVVTTRIGAAPEIVDQTCGDLVSPGDIEGLTSALTALVEAPHRRRTLGAAGPERARTLCAPEAQIPKIEALLGALGRTPLQAVI